MNGFKLAEAGEIVFDKPFTPDSALPTQSVNWLMTAPNHYRAILPGSAAMFATYDLVIETPENLSGTLKAVTQVPGQTPCTIFLPVSYQYAGG